MYDLIIVGAGPAGIAAAIYAARKKMNFIVLSTDIGGRPVTKYKAVRYMGYQFITGIDLVKKFQDHLDGYNFGFEIEEVKNVTKLHGIFQVHTSKGAYESKALILASGKVPKKLNVPGEELYVNRGVTYCATCDAPVFTGMDTAVIGGGNSALDAALQLTRFASKIYLINISSKLGGDEILRAKVSTAENVTVMNSSKILEIMGNESVDGIRIEQDEIEKKLYVKGVFIEIGSVSSSDYVKDLVKLNEDGEIIIDKKNRTSAQGIFAAGDVTDIPEKQIIIATGEGAKALLSAYEYLTRLQS